MALKITILGKVPKGDKVRESFVDWKDAYVAEIKHQLPDANILHGDHIRDDAGAEMVVGHDLWTVKNADIVMVNGAEKVGAGTAQEMLMAKFFKKPLVIVMPKETHHRRSNLSFNGVLIEDWKHPFLEVCSDYVAESVEDGVRWVREYASGAIQQPIKDISVFENAIDAFEGQLPQFIAKYHKQGW